MSVLIICEKPSVAKTVALALGAAEQKDGYLSGNGLLVSWCIGHLISMTDAGSYDERYKKWRYLLTGKISCPNAVRKKPDMPDRISAQKQIVDDAREKNNRAEHEQHQPPVCDGAGNPR